MLNEQSTLFDLSVLIIKTIILSRNKSLFRSMCTWGCWRGFWQKSFAVFITEYGQQILNKQSTYFIFILFYFIPILILFYSHLHYNGYFNGLKSGANIALDSLFFIIPAFAGINAGIKIVILANIKSSNCLRFQWIWLKLTKL